MSLSAVDYLNLSALAYLSFSSSSKAKTIDKLIKDEEISKKDLNEKAELSPLRDSSNPLSSWTLIAVQSNTHSGFAMMLRI